eukprot:CAMPEP_0172840138 /NCGR_PEP_ID=MMETSP1075-20121228/29088_1 /TAXON_ID=2916 /ORGANISM="Ceratium fusus, Strain PA161109" /LENGTH=244 /DNA_ID=CAMNT_0013683909 /DNA_START=1 /DNA_END=731 /DNA_ORIENTATION=-
MDGGKIASSHPATLTTLALSRLHDIWPFLVFLGLIMGMMPFLVQHGWEPMYESRQAEVMCSFYVLGDFNLGVMYTIVIPDSYRLAKAVGHTATFSGLIVGSQMLAACFGSLIMRLLQKTCPVFCYKKLWILQVLGILGLLSGALLYLVVALTVDASHNLAHGAELLLFAQTWRGVFGGMLYQHNLSALMQLTPDQEKPEQTTRMMFFGMVGIGLGPALPSGAQLLNFYPEDLVHLTSVGFMMVA